LDFAAISAANRVEVRWVLLGANSSKQTSWRNGDNEIRGSGQDGEDEGGSCEAHVDWFERVKG